MSRVDPRLRYVVLENAIQLEDEIVESKDDVNGRRQTTKVTSDFEFFSSNP